MDTSRYTVLQHSLREKNDEKKLLEFWKFKYGRPFKVVFCIHDSKIPLLEYYKKDSDIDDHTPEKIVDLFGVNNVRLCPKNNKKFIIMFEQRKSMKFLAENSDIARKWVNELNIYLRVIYAFKESTIIPESL
uniref:PH domain-containing protein n=1 Tax=Panagrolaimus superbus TaxID=310955 RepID=A0A914Z7Y0_9BILA